MLRSIYRRGKRDLPHLAATPVRLGLVGPRLPKSSPYWRGNWDHCQNGKVAGQRSGCRSRESRSCLEAISCSSTGDPRLSSDPAADGPQPCQLGLASGLTPKSCHLVPGIH